MVGGDGGGWKCIIGYIVALKKGGVFSLWCLPDHEYMCVCMCIVAVVAF